MGPARNRIEVLTTAYVMIECPLQGSFHAAVRWRVQIRMAMVESWKEGLKVPADTDAGISLHAVYSRSWWPIVDLVLVN